jgi:hypothetical protein
MSTGISICTQPEEEIDGGYFQNFAAEFWNINFAFKKEGCDLSPYLYCPESEEDEDEMRESGSSEEDIAYMKMITTDDFHPISEVLEQVKKALALAKCYDEADFEYGKDPFIEQLEEVVQALAPHAESNISVQFLRG